MNTLDKISKMEAKLGVLETMVQNLLPSNNNMDKLSLLEKQNREIFGIISEKQDLVVNRIMSIEQSFAAMAKTLNAVIQELEANNAINSSNVMNRIRLMDEKAEQDRVQTMLGAGAIEETEVINENSMLVVSQTLQREGQMLETISDYRVYELNSPLNSKETIDAFLGKTAGNVVEITINEGTIFTTILKVYDYKKMEAQNIEQGSETVEAPTA